MPFLYYLAFICNKFQAIFSLSLITTSIRLIPNIFLKTSNFLYFIQIHSPREVFPSFDQYVIVLKLLSKYVPDYLPYFIQLGFLYLYACYGKLL